ncbi:MAG: exodeoxyribonuclease VII large subunit [Anaerolineae bacterium]|nr:exodeoxyribonuclease VII large subunit [Anaerolineae bacterium]
MEQLSFLPPTAWSVTEVNRYLRDLFESDHNLGDLWVQGELSNVSRPRSGHLYFTLKDERATLRGVMWRSSVQRLGFTPNDGDAVEVHGSINIYEAGGQVQLYADTIKPLGTGALYQEFSRLKAKLEAEGLFAEERKRPLPRWPRRIGIVTSPTGAALRDMLNTLRRRYPLVEVVIAPSPVQGQEAPLKLAAGLLQINRVAKPDVILLARGGGSIEDLWAFNDERVAYAIAASAAPVITGVGHETDFTIADFVADLRAPTPTAAAELATPSREDLLPALAEIGQRFANYASIQINERRWQIGDLGHRLQRVSPLARIRSDRQRLDEIGQRAATLLRHRLQMQYSQFQANAQRLDDLNPHTVLGRGYAIVSHADGRTIRSAARVQPGDALNVRVSDGDFDVKVADTLRQSG